MSSKKEVPYGYNTIYLASAGLRKDELAKALKKLVKLNNEIIQQALHNPDLPLIQNVSKVYASSLKRKLEAFGAVVVVKEEIPVFEDGQELVKLLSAGTSKIQVIKLVRQYTALDLKHAKEIVDVAPVSVGYFTENSARDLKNSLEQAGATVSINDEEPDYKKPMGAKETVQVRLVDSGDQKIQAIKVVREFSGLDLAKAKDIVDASGFIPGHFSKQQASEIIEAFAKIGARAEIVE